MVQKNRSKEVWLVPKRGSLHQTICLIESLLVRKYDQTNWNGHKQNNIGNDLRKRGAVREKRSPSNQSIRTLLASVPQYFGFLYIDSSTTPNTVKLTDAGKKLYDYHKINIKNIGTLNEGKENGELLETSPILLEQFEKLQITNPIILKDCENILVFPFRVVLYILQELDYLDREEIAYFIFSIRSEDEIPLVIERIKRFRNQSKTDRDMEIQLFKGTHIGNITLVAAPSASYFENLCVQTGIVEKVKVQKPNPASPNNDKISALRIKQGHEPYVKDILDNKYKDAQAYDFEDRVRLWVDYIGNPDRLTPPRDIHLTNIGKNSIIMLVEQNGMMLGGDLIIENDSLIHPMFLNEEYDLIVINPQNGDVLDRIIITPSSSNLKFEVNNSSSVEQEETVEDIGKSIIEHSAAKTFGGNFLTYLGVIENITKSGLIDNKNLRGAYYEYLFYSLLESLKRNGVIDDVYWNGRIVKFGLPRPAPGGKTGTPDIVFVIDGEYFVLEVTTIKAKASQFSAEGSSVPDHIKLFAEDNKGSIVNGIFSAPYIHSRNTSAMQSILNPLGINIKCIEDHELVKILLTKDRTIIINELKKN
jgi:hypothetical protein